jgi:hypothetical protein
VHGKHYLGSNIDALKSISWFEAQYAIKAQKVLETGELSMLPKN